MSLGVQIVCHKAIHVEVSKVLQSFCLPHNLNASAEVDENTVRAYVKTHYDATRPEFGLVVGLGCTVTPKAAQFAIDNGIRTLAYPELKYDGKTPPSTESLNKFAEVVCKNIFMFKPDKNRKQLQPLFVPI